MAPQNIVVVGGLTTASLLARDHHYSITVIAKHMPGDYDIEYASPWAGANFLPVAQQGTEDSKWEADTWPFLENLARNHLEAGIHFQVANIYHRKSEQETSAGKAFAGLMAIDPWWKTLFPDFQQIPAEELNSKYTHGTRFTSVCINTAIYLPWLVSQCLKNGVVFKRLSIRHICDAARRGVHHSGQVADIIFNCTGLSSRRLKGVEDGSLYPARGQVALVRNEADAIYGGPAVGYSPDEMMYIMTRAAGGGTILGGCYQQDKWESQPDPNLAVRIMKRCVEACPALTGGKGVEHLDVIRHSVGLRPARNGGARIEREIIDGVTVVHNYGHGGTGYQSSYGCALAAVKLVDEAATSRS